MYSYFNMPKVHGSSNVGTCSREVADDLCLSMFSKYLDNALNNINFY